MIHVVDTLTHDSFPFRDNTGALIFGKVDGDWTKLLLKDGATTAVTVTVTAVSGQSGYYDATFTPTETGVYQVFLSITHGGQAYNFQSDPFEVVSAAADGAALATAIAAVQATADAQDVIWTSARALKLDRIGASTVQVAATTLTNTDRLTFERGSSYLNADGLAKSWTVDGVTVASATLYLRTFAGVTVLTKTMTVSGATVRTDVSAVETAALSLGTPIYRYEVTAVLSGGSSYQIASGDCWVTD